MKKYLAWLGLSLALCGVAHAGGPDAYEAGIAFRLDPSLIRETWGGGKQARQFFEEQLPACFERTLKFSRWGDAGGRLDWIFTGPRAGVTLMATELCSPYAPNSAGPADQRLVPPGGLLTLTNVEK